MDRNKTAAVGLLIVATFVLLCVGCGGGGGGEPVVGQTLGLDIAEPDTEGAMGDFVDLEVAVTGSGTLYTAEFDIQANPEVFQSEVGPSVEVGGMPAGTVCRYKWLDDDTIKVLFASSTGIAAGEVLAHIPAYVYLEGDGEVDLDVVSINE